MKNTLLLLTFILGLQTANAQYVNIPDINFRAYLIRVYPSCMDLNTGMLDTTCSALLNEESLYIGSSDQISSLDGMQYFKNITSLSCTYNNISSLPPFPKRLKTIYCYVNKITTLPALPDSLTTIECWDNKISSLPKLPNTLYKLACENNKLDSLPQLPNTLNTLLCGANNLTKLPKLPNGLFYLRCSNNKITNLPQLPESLAILECYVNQLAALPKLPKNLDVLNCFSNQLTYLPALPPNLRALKTEKNQITELPYLPKTIIRLWVNDNPIKCLPLLPFNIEELYVTNTKLTCKPNITKSGLITDTILSICINPLDICALNPMARGIIYFDVNNNNKYDVNIDETFPEQIVSVLPDSWLGCSDINGEYIVKLDTSVNNTWSAINSYRYASITPVSYSKNPKDTLGLLNGSYDFGVHLIANVKDLEATLGSSPARPGFTTNVTVTANNVGTVNQANITIKLKKPTGFNVVTTSISPTSTVDDTLIWNNVSINYLEHQSINIELQVPVDAVLGSTIDYEAWSNGTQGDTTPIDNYAKWTETIRGSFDPNDKLVNKETLPPTYNAEKDRLLYTIRFQNTGTDTAFTVIVRDEIPTNLEVSSLRVVNASHPYQLIVREKNIVEVAFPNIQLPDSTANEAKSHGFVQLEFKPKAGLPVNAEINNNASIFFDYNAPVVTNTATTKIQITTGIANNKKLAFKLFPNPATSTITVELPYEGEGRWYLTDISGKIIQQDTIENNLRSFDISVNDISSGTYLLSLEINGIISTSKVAVVK